MIVQVHNLEGAFAEDGYITLQEDQVMGIGRQRIP